MIFLDLNCKTHKTENFALHCKILTGGKYDRRNSTKI